MKILKPKKDKYNDGKSATATLDTNLSAFNSATGKSVNAGSIVYYKATKVENNQYTREGSSFTPAPSTAGTYIAEITLDGVKTGEGQTGNVIASVPYTIAKASFTTKVSIEDWTYGNTESNPRVSPNTSNGDVTYKYSKNGTDYSDTVPTDAGNYFVKACIEETQNYEAVESQPEGFVISQRPVTVSGINADSKVYDGTTAATWTGTPVFAAGNVIDDDDLSVSITSATFKKEYVDTDIPVTFTGALEGSSKENYELNSIAGSTASITTRPITITAQDQTIALHGAIADGTGKVDISGDSLVTGHTLTDITLITDPDNTHSATATGKITPSGAVIKNGDTEVTSNYAITYADGTLVISPALPVVEVSASAADIIYGQTLKDSEITGTMKDAVTDADITGTFTWDEPETRPTVTEDSDTTEYDWIFTPENTQNYTPYTGTLTVTVNPKVAELKWTDTELVYNGAAQKPVAEVNNLEDGDVCQVTVEGEQTDYSASAYTAEATKLSNDNYILPAETTKEFTIAQHAITITAENQTVPLNGAIEEGTDKVAVTVGTLVTGHTLSAVTLTSSSTVNATTEGSITPSQAKILDAAENDVTENYAITYVDGILIVDKDPAELTNPQGNTLTYNGAAQKLATAGSTVHGEIQYALGADDKTSPITGWGKDVPEGTDAGTYYVWYRVIGDGNHTDSESGAVKAEIAQKTVTVTAKDQTIEANGSIVIGVEQADLSGAVEGHALNRVTLTADMTKKTITPSDAKIADKAGKDVTGNYRITFADGKLIIAEPDPDQVKADGVKDMIDALPEPEEVTVAHQDEIEAARGAYDDLTGRQKTLVGEEALQKLVNDEAALEKALGSLRTEIRVEQGAPSVTGSNLDTVAAELITQEEFDLGAKVWVEVTPLAADAIPEAEKEALQKEMESLGAMEGIWLDISMFKQVGGGTITPIHETKTAFQFSIVIPEEMRKEGRTFFLIRCHEGKTAVVASTMGNVLEGSTDVFSSYLLT